MPRYAVRLSYKGTDYHGWQIQNNAKTIQGELENAFSLLLKDKIALVGCGRTDTGVHAIDYYAYFNYEKEELASPILEKLIHKLLSNFRYRKDREFFKIDLSTVKKYFNDILKITNNGNAKNTLSDLKKKLF